MTAVWETISRGWTKPARSNLSNVTPVVHIEKVKPALS